jgi:hypothetical protein
MKQIKTTGHRKYGITTTCLAKLIISPGKYFPFIRGCQRMLAFASNANKCLIIETSKRADKFVSCIRVI